MNPQASHILGKYTLSAVTLLLPSSLLLVHLGKPPKKERSLCGGIKGLTLTPGLGQ